MKQEYIISYNQMLEEQFLETDDAVAMKNGGSLENMIVPESESAVIQKNGVNPAGNILPAKEFTLAGTAAISAEMIAGNAENTGSEAQIFLPESSSAAATLCSSVQNIAAATVLAGGTSVEYMDFFLPAAEAKESLASESAFEETP